jgi:predicted phage terminase large subunit-like protein
MTRGRFKIPPHVAYLDAILTRGILEGGLRLIVEEPPRHGKSLLVSDATPTWYLGHHPDKRVILCSYEADFAAGWGAKVRNNLVEHGAMFPKRPAPARGSRSRSRWDIEGRLGGMITAGIGGAITGRGGDLMIVDDYIKNADQAQSATWRDRTKDWWRSTFRTRLEPGGSIIVMATRWHEDDLIGFLLGLQNSADDDLGDTWTVVRLPAIAEAPDKQYPDPDPLGREPGEALWPTRWSVEQLRTLEASVGAYWWASMFQQRPAPAEGGLFKRAHVRRHRLRDEDGHGEFTLVLEAGRSMSPGGVYTVEAERVITRRFGQVVATMDLAGSTRTAADWTVITTGFRWPDGHVSVLDVAREQTRPEGHLGMLQAAVDRWRPAYVGVERKMWGSDLIADAQRAGVPVTPIDPDADKFTRALPAAAAYARGGVSHPHDSRGEWVTVLENELAGFPNAPNDDQVDTIAYLVHEAAGLGQSLPDDEPDEIADPLDDGVGYDDDRHW